VYSSAEIFGVSGDQLAYNDAMDPQTPASRAMVAAPSRHLSPPLNPARALVDPKGSAIVWVGAAALIGLMMVSGRIAIEAAVGGRVGRR
jgi:hypothetical protein